MSPTIESQLSLDEARARILARAEPGEPIEVSLGEAVGLVLAEPIQADVDHPPFDRASHDGYAVRADEATPGALLRVVRPGRSGRAGDATIEAGEAGRIRAGEPMPPGTDAILRPSHVRPDPEVGPTQVVEVLRAAAKNCDVTPRGAYLSSGATILAAGTRLKPAMIPLLAAQGATAPFCHRRVRVSIVAVGDQWVRPGDAPTMNRERNASNAALVALTIRAEAMPHDFQAVAGSRVRPTLERATTSPVVIILGASNRLMKRAWDGLGVATLVEAVAVAGLGRVRYGVIRDDDGRLINHVFQLASDPAAASIGFALLVLPLIARLQGMSGEAAPESRALAAGESFAATRRRVRAIPATCRVAPDGRTVAEVVRQPPANLLAWSGADGLLIFPPHSGPWRAGAAVEYVPLGPAL